MPENRYSGSVDEIIENVRRQQESQKPTDDSEVNAILASLGLGESADGPAPKQEPKATQPEKLSLPKQERPRRAPKADGEETGEIRLDLGRAEPRPDPRRETTGEICLDFIRAGLESQPESPKKEPPRQEPPMQAAAAPARENPIKLAEEPAAEPAREDAPQKAAARPADEQPAPKPQAGEAGEEAKEPAEEPERQAPENEQETKEDSAAELRRRFERAAAESVGADTDLDGSFVDFFSDHVAVIPEESPASPSLFNRFIKKRKKEEFQEAAKDPAILMPGVSDPENTPDEDPTGEVRLNVDLQDETGQIDTRLVADAVEAARQEEEPALDEEPTRETAAKKGFRFFGNDEEQPPFEMEEEPSQEEEAPDYDSLEDAPAVKASLGSAYARATLSMTVTGILTLALLYLGISSTGVFPAVLDPNQVPQAFLGVELVLLVVAAAFNFRPLQEGFLGLGRGRPSPNSLTALAVAGCALQCVVALLLPKTYDPVHLTLYAPIAALLLFGGAAGRRMSAGVVRDNFELITAGVEHSAAYRLQNMELTCLLAEGLEEERPVLLVSRPTSLMKGFLRKSSVRPLSDYGLQKLAWALGIVALVSGLVVYAREREPLQAVSALAAVACLGAPLCAILFSSLCARMQQRSAARVGAVVPGWGAVEELGRINTIVVGAKDLFPRGSVVLHGIKTFEKERIDLAILYAASVLVAGCDTLRDVFLNIIQNKTEMLYPVENLVNERGRGFTAWINGNRVILGNRNMMTAHDIDIPSLDYETRYTKGEKQPIYLAVSGKLFGMFIVDYRAGKETASVLRVLQQSGISLLVHSDDFSITGPLVEKVYRLRQGSVKVLTSQEMDHLATATGYLPESEGCMLHLGSFASYVGGMRSASSAASAQHSSCLVLCASVAVGAVVGLLLALSGGLLDLALPAIALYQVAWAVPTLAIPVAKKY